jgi:hypothetical protein
MIWKVIATNGTIVSTIAYIVTALSIRAEMKGLEKGRIALDERMEELPHGPEVAVVCA